MRGKNLAANEEGLATVKSSEKLQDGKWPAKDVAALGEGNTDQVFRKIQELMD